MTVFVAAGDGPAAAVDAALLGLRRYEWEYLHSPVQLHGATEVWVCFGSAHGAHRNWPDIAAQLQVIEATGRVHHVPDRAGD